jgi:hypothetical protein
MIRFIAFVILGCLLAACGASEPPKKSEISAKADEDSALTKEPARAAPELERRLLASIKADDGILTVQDEITGRFLSYYLPVTAPWMISCGVGMTVVFGASVSGDGSETRNEVEVRLAYGVIDQENCAVLGPLIAKRLQSVLQAAKR